MKEVPAIEGILAKNPAALGRAITLVEREDPRILPILDALRARVRTAFRVGITGPPGAGKSSLVRELVRRIRAGGEPAAVVAADPVSPISGGALLGDRHRIAGVGEDSGVFFRSVAHRGPAGEPCRGAAAAMDVLDASGYPWVFLESVGAGQSEVNVLRGTHVKVFVHSSDSGDEIQMLKAGLTETADLHVVGKCDRQGPKAWAAELEGALGPAENGRRRVFSASALTGEGVDAILEELRALRGERTEKQS